MYKLNLQIVSQFNLHNWHFNIAEAELNELSDSVDFIRSYDVIAGRFVLQHQPHRLKYNPHVMLILI